MLNIYVTSTQKKLGKTFIASGIAATMQSLGYTTSVYKPIQTGGIKKNGFVQSQDLLFVKTLDPYINTHFSYIYGASSEPFIAAEKENDVIDIEHIYNECRQISSISECVVIDGDSGLLSPIAPEQQTIDLIKRIQFPLLVVTNADENSINNTLLTINFAQEKGVKVSGVVINNIRDNTPKSILSSLPRVIEEYTSVKVLGLVSYLGREFTPEDLITVILNGIDIESVFGIKIEKLD